MSDRASTALEIDGIYETKRAIEDFDPEIKKALNKTIRKAMNVVKAGAQSRYPGGVWKVQISKNRALGSLATVGEDYDRKKPWAEAPGGVRAAIFEFAGSRSGGATPQAQGLIAHLNERYGRTGRFLWDAWDEGGKQAMETTRMAIAEAERILQAKLDASGEEF